MRLGIKAIRRIILTTLLLSASCLYAMPTSDHAWQNTLNGFDPTITDDSDLSLFDHVIQHATIVGLGETTHSTHEFFVMKHRLLKHLVTHEGYTVFAMEQSMARCYLMNDYVLHGIGDPKKILKSDNPMYDSQEVVDLIEWMRAYNQTTDKKIMFAGFDIQDDIYDERTPSPDIIAHLLQPTGDTVLMASNQQLSDLLTGLEKQQLAIEKDKAKGDKEAQRKDTQQLVTEEQQYETSLKQFALDVKANKPMLLRTIGRKDYAWLMQHIRLLHQLSEFTVIVYTGNEQDMFNYRDKMMAKNITWLQHYSNAKMVLWSHSGHTQGIPFTSDDDATFTTMGTHLKDALHNRYRAFTFLSYEGTYSVYGSKGFGDYPLVIPPFNTLESRIDLYRYPMAFFNFSDHENTPAFLHQTIYARDVPWRETTEQFTHYLSDATRAYDGAFYFRDTTSASNLLFQH
jgi:erythromycin esterase